MTAPLTIERDGLWAVIRNAAPYRAALRSLGARWRADNTWRLPLTVANMNALVRAGVPLDHYEPDISADPWLMPPRAGAHHHLGHPQWDKLYPYQRQAVDFLTDSPYPGALLALSPGLGKSAVSIVAAEMAEAWNVLTLCPKVLIPIWRQERERWGMLPWNDPKQDRMRIWQVTNWEYALRHQDEFDVPWDLVILDESVLVKNRNTQRFKLAKALRRKAQRMWLLSGSPITRHVDDLWTQLHLCFPDGFSNFWRFANAYCFVDANIWGGREVTGSRPFATSAEWRDLMFVRNQAEVLPDLPDFIELNIPIELTGQQKKLYDRALHDFVVDLEGKEMPITTKMAQLVRLQQLVSHPGNCDQAYRGNVAKLEALTELLEARAINLPLLVWTYHRQTAIAVDAALTAKGLRSTHVIGGMQDKADSLLQAFRDGHFDAVVLSLGVGRFGLTLTNTRTVVYYDKTWSSDEFIQSMSRVRRIGLDHRFHIINLHAPRTTDDLIVDNLADKAKSIAAVSNADLAQILRAL